MDLIQEESTKQFKSHVTECVRLLSTLTSDKELLKTIRHHHKKYNGKKRITPAYAIEQMTSSHNETSLEFPGQKLVKPVNQNPTKIQ